MFEERVFWANNLKKQRNYLQNAWHIDAKYPEGGLAMLTDAYVMGKFNENTDQHIFSVDIPLFHDDGDFTLLLPFLKEDHLGNYDRPEHKHAKQWYTDIIHYATQPSNLGKPIAPVHHDLGIACLTFNERPLREINLEGFHRTINTLYKDHKTDLLKDIPLVLHYVRAIKDVSDSYKSESKVFASSR